MTMTMFDADTNQDASLGIDGEKEAGDDRRDSVDSMFSEG